MNTDDPHLKCHLKSQIILHICPHHHVVVLKLRCRRSCHNANTNLRNYGKGEQGKAWMQKACFGCGSTEHLLKDCPKNPKIQNVEDEAPEVLFIGNVQNRKEEEWKRIPMKVQLGDFMRVPVKRPTSTQKAKNRFKVLQVDEDDCEGGRDEVLHIRTVKDLGSSAKQHDQARVLKFGGRVQTAREAEENMDNYGTTMRDEQYVQMVGENNKKGEWVSLGVGGHYHRLGSGRVVLAGWARRCFPDTAEQQEDGAENGQWRGHGALWPEGEPLQVQQRRGQRADRFDLPSDGREEATACRASTGRTGKKVMLAAGDGESYI